MKLKTRVKSKVDKYKKPKLKCNVCETWKSPDGFYVEKTGSHKGTRNPAYDTLCRSCIAIRSRLTTQNKNGKTATNQEIKEFLAGGKTVAPTVKLNSAAHPASEVSYKLKPLSKKAQKELDERREEKEAQEPDAVCYLIGMEGDDKAVKVGTTNDVAKRVKQCQTGNPRKLIVLGTLPGGRETEARLHQKYAATQMDWMVGEWLAKTPGLLNEFKVTAA